MHCIWDRCHNQFRRALPQTFRAASALNSRRQNSEGTNQHNILLRGNLFAVLSDEPFLFLLTPKASGPGGANSSEPVCYFFGQQ